MNQNLRAGARRLAGRACRRIGALGRRVRGASAGDGTTATTDPHTPGQPDPTGKPDDDGGIADPGGGPRFGVPPWAPMPDLHRVDGAFCNVCRWEGPAFAGDAHVELSQCPSCGANGRDRFVHWCLARRADPGPALRVIECSPRLGPAYRSAMATWFFYRTSDYDLRTHEGNLQIDLQAIDLPDACLDVVLCSHVLEHVPHTGAALDELRRVIAPGGHLLLQVPVLQGRTAPPTRPEFHADQTPVFWRFGFDLTERLRAAGFETALLCTRELLDAVGSGGNPWAAWSGEFDVPDILAGAVAEDLVVVADRDESAALGIDPGYMYLTWHGRVPG